MDRSAPAGRVISGTLHGVTVGGAITLFRHTRHDPTIEDTVLVR